MTINEAYGLSEYVDERIKALEHRTEMVMDDKRCCIPPVNPHQKIGYCKDCKYFEYDSVAEEAGMTLTEYLESISLFGGE